MPIKLFDFFPAWKIRRFKAAYPSHQTLFEGLKAEEGDAIQYLSLRVSGSVIALGKQYKLLREDTEELLCDCVMILLAHIREERYVFLGNDPATYVIEIAKKRVRTKHRAYLRRQTEDLESFSETGEAPEAGAWTDQEHLKFLLNQLDESCRLLVTLTHLDGLKDKEIIERQLTSYTSAEALKVQRGRCMKRLTAIARRFDKSEE